MFAWSMDICDCKCFNYQANNLKEQSLHISLLRTTLFNYAWYQRKRLQMIEQTELRHMLYKRKNN